MSYREFKLQEFMASVSYHPSDFLDGFATSLRDQQMHTEDERMRWKDVDLTVTEGRVMLNGKPVHPYVLWRLGSHLIGVKKNRWEQWLKNPELLVQALHAVGPVDAETEMMIRSVYGEVIYCTQMVMDVGHHIDYFQPMLDKFYLSSRQIKTPVTMVGYMDDPLWTHVKLLYLPKSERTHYAGLQFDVNYMFSRSLRGRASLSQFAYDLKWESTLNLDTWWSIRTVTARNGASMLPPFTKAILGNTVPMSRRMANAMTKMNTIKEKRSRQDWRQQTILDMNGKYVSRSKIRDGIIAFDESSRKSPLDFAFALSRELRDLPLERRMEAERVLANRLKSTQR